ncbi:MAG: prepilin-type N-terminal cleavage/methylation domain-containing protein [Myxococcales bacterium]|nr:prepilin-type N-terminal cleavage/methylation domain-containing protein [Myxococcales bacterium]
MKTHRKLASLELRHPDTLLERIRIAAALRRRAAAQRGVTLFEVLIVVAILAMVAGGVAVFALPKFREAQIKTAETGARTIRTAVQQWQATNNETSCPTVSQLVQEKHIDSATNTDDPWGEAYILTCTDDEVIVTSKGPDKKKGTKDDIRMPKGAEGGGEE